MANTALFIGRFQPFHIGHLSVAREALKENDFLIIAIGSAENSFLPDNPFTAGERFEMIRAALDEDGINPANYAIIPVRDINNYDLWVEHVQQLVPPFKTVHTGSSIVKKLFIAHNVYSVKDVVFKKDISGTKIRKMILDGSDWENSVPPTVAKKIKSLNSTERLKKIS